MPASATDPTTLTRRQWEFLLWVLRYFGEHARMPTYREIGAGLGIGSTNGVYCHLAALEKKGLVRLTKPRPGREWAIRAVEVPGLAAAIRPAVARFADELAVAGGFD